MFPKLYLNSLVLSSISLALVSDSSEYSIISTFSVVSPSISVDIFTTYPIGSFQSLLGIDLRVAYKLCLIAKPINKGSKILLRTLSTPIT